MKTKQCFKCKRRRGVEHFYRHPEMADGHLGKCKDCTKSDVQANYARNRTYYSKYDRQRSQTPKRKRQTAEGMKRYRAQYPEKYRATNAVNNAIRDGRLTRQPCEKCGAKAHAHHDDYFKPLDVRWLCTAHHTEHHKYEKANQTI